MKINLGIDLGSSATKIAGFNGEALLLPCSSDKELPVENALAAFLENNHCSAGDIDRIALTGAGAEAFSGSILGLPARKVDEFTANSLGGTYFAKGKDPLMVISIGTGTSFVAVRGGKASHMGGSGIGGGTIVGLSRLMLGTDDVNTIRELSLTGSAANTDIRISDIADKPVAGLDMAVSVSNFGKAQPELRLEDRAAGIVHMVIESICQTAALIARNTDIKFFVIIGSVSAFPQCPEITKRVKLLFPEYDFLVAEQGSYGTAIGAALAAQQ